MPEKLWGKLFNRNAEATTRMPTDEENERARRQLDAFNTELRAAQARAIGEGRMVQAPSRRDQPKGSGPRIEDDLSGTAREGWTLENGDTWRDVNGNVVYTLGPGPAWYDTTGKSVYDLIGNRPDPQSELYGGTLDGDTWRDANGQAVYTRGPDGGWYDTSGRLVYGRLGNRQQ